MVQLEHVAIWTNRLEELKAFYVRYFGAKPNEKYTSTEDFGAAFESYFLQFDGGARLELMNLARIPQGDNENGFESTGLTHISFSVESAQVLEEIYERCKGDGVKIVGEPRMTGDGFYEACVLDPDGNRVEIAVVP